MASVSREQTVFDFFRNDPAVAEKATVDRNLVRERIAEALRDGGLDPDGREFACLFKLLSDDIDWYLDQVGDDES